MKGDRSILIMVLALTACVGCSSQPDVLRVGRAGLGSYWELDYWEGPVKVSVAVERDTADGKGTVETAEYVVEAFGARLVGWGAKMPWSWFRSHRLVTYLVRWRGPLGSGTTVDGAEWALSGYLSRPDLAMMDPSQRRDGDVTELDLDACRRARDVLLRRLHARDRGPSDSDPDRPDGTRSSSRPIFAEGA